MKKISIRKILEKKGKEPIACLAAYTKPVAEIIDKYCDIVLVGDSVGMVLYGYPSTRQVSLDTMIRHAKGVRSGAKRSLVVVDMPYNTYRNKLQAYKNAKKIIHLTKCHAVKVEGGKKIANIIKYLTAKRIPVMGHIGLLPQSANLKYSVKGKDKKQKTKILADAVSIVEAGVFAVVIECVVEDLAKEITKVISVPTIGIGASKYCDGQILVIDDLIGLSSFYPKFVKRYGNVSKIIDNCVKKYCNDVKRRHFPGKKNIYKL